MRAAFLLITALLLAAPTAQAGSTSLVMRSEPGDFVGAGQEYLYTLADGTFSINRNPGNGVSIAFARQIPSEVQANLVGVNAEDKTPSGLWPSDHAGVVARLRFNP